MYLQEVFGSDRFCNGVFERSDFQPSDFQVIVSERCGIGAG